MSANTFANIRAIVVVIIALFIVLRAFQVYSQTRSPRLFILGLTMIMIALTTTADTIGDNVSFHLNSYWFNYFGQTTNYTFFFFSLINSSEKYLVNLIRWQIIVSALLLSVLLIGPAMPYSFPALGVIRAILSSGRAIPCLCICLYYIAAFMTKETRFSLLMGVGFLIVCMAYYMIFPRYLYPHQDTIQITGDFLRATGFATLLIALLW